MHTHPSFGCGQVRLAVPEGDDFERCAIEIWVKFRDEEELQRLSSHRQSGGERSVSTILYLIAIQARIFFVFPPLVIISDC